MVKNKRTLAAVAIMVILVSVLFLAFTSRQTQADATKASTRPVAVEVTPVASAHLTETVSAVGTIAAMKDVVVSSETAGRVTAVLVKVGDVVRQGQALVRVDDELKAIAVEQAKAQLQAAETSRNKAQKDFERSEKLFSAGDIADVELESYRLAAHAAEAQYKSAAVGLRLAQRQLDDTRVKAPLSGVIASRKVEVGEMVSPGREVANVVDISSVKVRLSIPEEEIGKIRVKQPAVLRIDSEPGAALQGSVYTIGSKAETANGHTYPVEVVVRNNDPGLLKVGMFARVEIQSGSADNALAISKESIVNEGTTPSVFVVENNVARLRPIKLGIRAGDRYQVLEGLRAGELVISFGQKSLKDGSVVQYK